MKVENEKLKLVGSGSSSMVKILNYHNYLTTQSIITIFQLRYLQTLNSIAAENNSTIIFPVPVDVISSIMSCDKVTDLSLVMY